MTEELDVDRLARAWLNAMTDGDHNERCLDQSPEMDCPVGAEVRDFVPLVAAEYVRLLPRVSRAAADAMNERLG